MEVKCSFPGSRDLLSYKKTWSSYFQQYHMNTHVEKCKETA